MSALEVRVAGDGLAFRPGEEVRGEASWSLDEDPTEVELRLFWRTEGKGTQDVGVVETVTFEKPGGQDRRDFRVRLPAGPYSFSGTLVSLVWAREVVAEPGGAAGRTDIVLAPTGREVRLTAKEK